MGATLKLWVKTCLFLVSYVPLFVIMRILHYDHQIIPYVAIVCTIIGVVGTAITFRVLNQYAGQYKEAKVIEPATKVNFQYFLAYVIDKVSIGSRQLISNQSADSVHERFKVMNLVLFDCIETQRP